MTKTRYVLMLSLIAGVLLTGIGVADADGPFGVLLTPGRLFNHALGFDTGPPEAGVIYGLAVNCAALAAAVATVAFGFISFARRNAKSPTT